MAAKKAKPVTVNEVPVSVRRWFRTVFARCNLAASQKLSEIPTRYEPELDMSIIEALNREAPPHPKNTDGWHLYIQTHFLGGRAMFRNWEVADIGVVVQYYKGSDHLRTKVALLQSKRLYPNEVKSLPNFRQKYQEGFFSLVLTPEGHMEEMATRHFTFDADSKYAAFKVARSGTDADPSQVQDLRIAEYEQSKQIPVYYLFYNPYEIPWKASIPQQKAPRKRVPKVGCRVVPAKKVREAMIDEDSLRYETLLKLKAPFGTPKTMAGWRLENFIANEVIPCNEGYVPKTGDEGLWAIFTQRGAPISAAVSLTINVPDNVTLKLPEATEPPKEDT